MNRLFVALAGALMIAIPYGAASHECDAPKQETIIHPTSGTYIYVADREAPTETDPASIGEWTETNGIEGLQTKQCVVGGHRWFGADTKSDVLA